MIRRLSERKELGVFTAKTAKKVVPSNIPLKAHVRGPVRREFDQVLQFKQSYLNALFFSTSDGNNCVQIDNKFLFHSQHSCI